METKKRGRPPKGMKVEVKEFNRDDWNTDAADMKALRDKVESLEQSEVKNQETIKMLTEVADRGRMLNYQSKKDPTKKPMKVNLSVYDDRILVGWRTLKDRLITNPTTGLTIGEEQEYELILLDKESSIHKEIIQGYPRFSDIRYSERVEGEVVGKREDLEGKIDYDVLLPDGREISVDSRFIN